MLTKRTTFVVGAGASKSYGLPTAGEIYDLAIALNSESHIYQLLLDCGIQANDLRRTIQSLRLHGGPSIDEFIEHRRHNPVIVDIGKHLIAAFLGQTIAGLVETQLNQSDDDWIAYVVKHISAGVPDASRFAEVLRNDVKFLTFS